MKVSTAYIIRILLIGAIVFVALTSCSTTSNEETWDKMPWKISSFITEYFAGECQSFNELSNGDFQVVMKNGPTIIFNNDYNWISVNGNGGTISEYFLYNCLPETLYDYIEGLDYLDQVYTVKIENGNYYVELIDTNVKYDTATKTITET